MEKSILYLDCDETLLWSRSQRSFTNSIEFDWVFNGKNLGTCYTIARPSAKSFLEAVKGKYSIQMITQGHIDFQKTALAAAGLLEYFDEDGIFGYSGPNGREVNKPEPGDAKWLLIDNQHSRDYILTPKMSWLKSEFREGVNFLQCEGFWGYGDSNPLTDLLPAVEEILG